jgi:hypothetical protein
MSASFLQKKKSWLKDQKTPQESLFDFDVKGNQVFTLF